MKKVIIFLFMLFMFTGFVNATKIQDLRCNYELINPYDESLGKFQIEIYNYDDGNGNYTAKIFYENYNDKMVEYRSGLINDYKNYDGGLPINPFMSKGKDYSITKIVNEYKKTGKCLKLYYNEWTNNSVITIDTDVFVPEGMPYNPLSPKSVYVRIPGSDKWITESELYSQTDPDDTNPDETKPEEQNKVELECSYDMSFETLSLKSKVIFRREAFNGKKIYYVTVNGIEKGLDTLNDDVIFELKNANLSAFVRILSEDLKKIFEWDSCISGDYLYQYMDKNSTGSNIYFITLDGERATENSLTGKVGDGTGEKPSTDVADKINNEGKYLPKPPDYEMGKHLNCKELLGNDLTAIVKAAIRIMQIVAAIIAILKGMIIVIPAVAAKDADALKKASKTLITLAIILLIVLLLPLFVKVIGQMLDFDLSCFV